MPIPHAHEQFGKRVHVRQWIPRQLGRRWLCGRIFMPAPLAHDQFGTRVRVLQWIRHQLGWRCLCARLKWCSYPSPSPRHPRGPSPAEQASTIIHDRQAAKNEANKSTIVWKIGLLIVLGGAGGGCMKMRGGDEDEDDDIENKNADMVVVKNPMEPD